MRCPCAALLVVCTVTHEHAARLPAGGAPPAVLTRACLPTNVHTCRTLRRKIKKTARLWIRIAATVPVTRKPMGIRMGKGKGAIDFYATPVRPGQIIFEFDRVPRQVALQALQAAQAKFPCKLGFVEWS